MSANKTSGSRSSQSPTEDLSRSLQTGAADAMAVPQKVAEANLLTGVEVLNFMSRRLRQQADLLDRLSKCRDFNQAAEAQRQFWEKASADYADELSQISDLARKNLAALTNIAGMQFGPVKSS